MTRHEEGDRHRHVRAPTRAPRAPHQRHGRAHLLREPSHRDDDRHQVRGKHGEERERTDRTSHARFRTGVQTHASGRAWACASGSPARRAVKRKRTSTSIPVVRSPARWPRARARRRSRLCFCARSRRRARSRLRTVAFGASCSSDFRISSTSASPTRRCRCSVCFTGSDRGRLRRRSVSAVTVDLRGRPPNAPESSPVEPPETWLLERGWHRDSHFLHLGELPRALRDEAILVHRPQQSRRTAFRSGLQPGLRPPVTQQTRP